MTGLFRITITAGFWVLVCCMTLSVHAQVAVIDYVKIERDKLDDYLKLEGRWKKIHEARLDKNLILSWGLYEIMFTGSADSYNYATVTVYDNLDLYDRSWDIRFLTESYPEMDDAEINEFYSQTLEAKNLVRSVVLRHLLSTSTNPSELPAYVLVNGMKVISGSDKEYQLMEEDVFMPIHEEGIRQGTRAAWSLWEKFYGGNYSEYQYLTLDAYHSFKQIDNDSSPALFKKLHPNSDFIDVLSRMNGIRTIMLRQVWRLIEFVEDQD